VVMASGISWEKTIKTVLSACGPELENVHLADLYQGGGLPENTRCLTLRFTSCLKNRTLTVPEVESAVRKILDKLSSELGARLR